MSEQSSQTPPVPTGSEQQTQTTNQTPPTSSTTPPQSTEKTPPSSEDTSLLNQKPAAPVDGEKKPEGEAKPEGAPEKYEDFKVPEGYELDKGLAEEAGGIFKKYNLTQAAAQELIDLYSRESIKGSQAALKAVKDMRADWVAKAKALPGIGTELGPEGKVVKDVNRALDSLVQAKSITSTVANEFRIAMDTTGAGDHPAFIQVFHALIQPFLEGTPVRGNAPSAHGQSPTGQTQRKTAAAEIWPSLPAG